MVRLFAAGALLLLVWGVAPGRAESDRPSDSDCMMCHEDQTLKRSAGGSLYVDLPALQNSVHGQAGLACVDCHTDLAAATDFPHAESLKAPSCDSCHEDVYARFGRSVHAKEQAKLGGRALRCGDCHVAHSILPRSDPRSAVSAFHVQEVCLRCHKNAPPETPGRATQFVASYEESVHSRALRKAGLGTSATCVTCHGSHGVVVVSDVQAPVSRARISQTCGYCHVGVLLAYDESVHGRSFRDGHTQAPVCTDCHGEHRVEEATVPSSRVFAKQVPETCGRCHEDMVMARQFNLSTRRLASFESSFHGVALRFGELRVANCASCHGYHDILPESDARSMIHPENIPSTCGHCHLNAGTNWARGKVHVAEAKTDNYWVYVVEALYTGLISVMIGGFVLFIFADLWSWRRRDRDHGSGE